MSQKLSTLALLTLFPLLIFPSLQAICPSDCTDLTSSERHGRAQVNLDIFCWQAHQDGLAVGIDKDGDAAIAEGRVINQPIEWDPGFRLGFDYIIPHDLWRAGVLWTQFHNHADRSTPDPTLPSWLAPVPTLTNDTFRHLDIHWRLHMGFIDGFLKRDLCTSKQLMISPLIGLRYAWIRQKYNFSLSASSSPSFQSNEVRMKNKFWGLGILAGLTTDWLLGKGFSLIGTGALSLLPGVYYIHQDEDQDPGSVRVLKVKSSFKGIQQIAQLALGVKWTHLWDQGRSQITLKLLWENMLFPSHNKLVRFTSANTKGTFVDNQGDLSIQGWTFGAEYRF